MPATADGVRIHRCNKSREAKPHSCQFVVKKLFRRGRRSAAAQPKAPLGRHGDRSPICAIRLIRGGFISYMLAPRVTPAAASLPLLPRSTAELRV